MNSFKTTTLTLVNIILLLSFLSCNQQKTKEESRPARLNKIEHIQILADTTQSYQLYLPTSYNQKEKFPVVFLFDPHGKGAIPVKKLQKKAEELGYILVGSNNSRNGIDHPGSICQNLVYDVLKRYSIDRNRIFGGGFSGGARVAGLVLPKLAPVKGIIACGAGLIQAIQLIKDKNIAYMGIVGNQDFNFREAILTRQRLTQHNIDNHLIVYSGEHEWPADSTLSKGLTWFEYISMKRGWTEKNKHRIKKLYKENLHIAKEYREKKDFIKAFHQYQWLNTCFSDLININKVAKANQELNQKQSVRNYYNTRNRLLKKEQKLYNEYINAFIHRDTNWWKSEITEWNNKLNQVSNQQYKHFLIRLKNYWSMAGYSISLSSIEKQETEKALHSLNIYEIIDPQNPDLDYLKAKLFAQTGKQEKAMEHLKNAAEKGFNNWIEVMEDTVFSQIKEHEEFKLIVEK